MVPIVFFTSLPFMGDMAGIVSGIVDIGQENPAKYKIALYIKVNKGWWNKPMFSRRDTFITQGGFFGNRTVTGGLDQEASHIAAFLVPINFQVPTAHGILYLPDSLYRQAVTWTEAYRLSEGSHNQGFGFKIKS